LNETHSGTEHSVTDEHEPAKPTEEAFAQRMEEERGESPQFRPPTEISQEPVELAVAEEQAAVDNAHDG
jgi:hypothetical protein